MELSSYDFGAVVNDPPLFDQWLVENKLLQRVVYCPECFAEMKIVAGHPVVQCSKRSLHENKRLLRESRFKGTILKGAERRQI